MKRGQLNEGLAFALDLLIAGLVLVVLLANARAGIDVEGLKRAQAVQNLGLTISSISALDGNFNYTYLTKENKNMYGWKGFYAGVFDSRIASSESYKSIDEFAGYPEGYSFFVFSGLKTPDAGLLVEKSSVEMAKGSVFEIGSEVGSTKTIKCSGVVRKYPIRPLHNGAPEKFFTAGGKAVDSPEEVLVGFEKQFFSGGERVYPGSFGLVNPSLNVRESDVMKFISGESSFALPSAGRHILLTTGSYDPEKSFVIAFFPYDSDDFGTACALVNAVAGAVPVDGVMVFPYRGGHILLELGNINNPVLLTGGNPALIKEALDEFAG